MTNGYNNIIKAEWPGKLLVKGLDEMKFRIDLNNGNSYECYSNDEKSFWDLKVKVFTNRYLDTMVKVGDELKQAAIDTKKINAVVLL